MNVTEFKRILSALGTYATAREKASGPDTLIGVQTRAGVLKLIAGNKRGGVTVTTGIGYDSDHSFVVPARPLLNAAKVLKGKLDLRWEVGPDRLEVVTDKGGAISCSSVGPIKSSGFAVKPRRVERTAFVNGPAFGQIARIFDAVQRDIESTTPTIHYYEGKAVITAVSPVMKELYATFTTRGTETEDEAYGSAYMDFWNSLKIMSEDGTIEFGQDGMIARSGIYEAFSAPYLVSPWNPKTRTSEPPRHPTPWPELGFKDEAAQARVTIDRKVLIDAIKGQMPDDEYQRITFQVDTGTFQVYPYGAEAGLSLPAATEGQGIRSVQGPLMIDMLRAIDSKEVELAWGNPAPAIRLNGKEYIGWTVLIAPVTMNR